MQANSLQSRLVQYGFSAAGLLTLAYSLYRVYEAPVRLDWTLTLAVAILISWRIQIWIPGVRSQITLTDSFIYIAALILGPWAAVVLASIDGLAKSPRGSNNKLIDTVGVSVGAMNIALLAASLTVIRIFGPLDQLVTPVENGLRLALALGLLALINYFVYSGIAAGSHALANRKNFARVWIDNYLWTAPAFFVGAVAAGIVARAIAFFGFFSFVVAVPILALSYVVSKAYLGKVEESHEHIEKLTRLHLATIETLTMAIDAKDPAARGHIQRVRLLAEGLARAVGYPEDQMEGLKAAALLHDIGKLAVPEHILSKPAKLTPAEYSKITVHPVVGADILSNVEFPYEVVPIVKHHHERYDGSGYPDGLAGEQIPLGARILTVVDCYEALITTRSYRARFTQREAIEMMSQESGVTFDPVILAKFVENISEITANLPLVIDPPVLFEGVGFKAIEPSPSRGFGLAPANATEKALLDIAAAQQEVLSLYEISQTLGSTLKLSEVLPIIGAKLERVASFTTLVIYLLRGNRLVAEHATGRNADAIKGIALALGQGGAGWVAEHREPLVGGRPMRDLQALGSAASVYSTATILPLSYQGELVGSVALYCAEEQGHSADEVRMLEAISLHAATAIHNALAFEQTTESALTDSLTGLPNSRYMYGFFEQERSRAARHGYPLVLMMMDLDGFKKVNDTYGHHIGDEILRKAGALAKEQLRSGDTLIRYAGDEFVAVLHRATADTIVDLKCRLQTAVDSFEHEVRPGRVARVGISIGHAIYGVDGIALDELMEVADQRMYQDKAARKAGTTPISLAAHQVVPGTM